MYAQKHRDVRGWTIVRFPVELDNRVLDHRRWVACLQLLVVGITFTGASAFIHFQAISNGERGGPGLIRRQDLLVLGLL
ncbi:hypothetical protein V6N12_006666 [Hibiscus sabdariffa]|uniref:Uncharacterized protein n=1 Tax=Hibiscus sabdariffa TaxID=183260 RepID=A0ABR2EZJ8_9ROSI